MRGGRAAAPGSLPENLKVKKKTTRKNLCLEKGGVKGEGEKENPKSPETSKRKRKREMKQKQASLISKLIRESCPRIIHSRN